MIAHCCSETIHAYIGKICIVTAVRANTAGILLTSYSEN